MSKKLFKKFILSSSIALVGLTTVSTLDTNTNLNKAQAHHISTEEKNIAQLKAYYTQTPQIFSNKYLEYDSVIKGFHVSINSHNWDANVKIIGDTGWNNAKQLDKKYVDVFGLTDKNQTKFLWGYTDYFTCGLTPAHSGKDPEHTLELTVNKKVKSSELKITDTSDFLKTKKQTLTLKELDFRIREYAVKKDYLYNSETPQTGFVTITKKDGTVEKLEITKRLGDWRSNDYIKPADIKSITVDIEE